MSQYDLNMLNSQYEVYLSQKQYEQSNETFWLM